MATTGFNVLDDRNRPITLEPGAFAVDENGVVRQNEREVAQLALRRVEHPDRLTKSGDGLLRTSPTSGGSQGGRHPGHPGCT